MNRAPGRGARWPLIGLLLGLFGFFGFFAHGYLENSDTEVTLHSARALWLRGDPGLLTEGSDTWPAERILAGEFIAKQGRYGMVGQNGKSYVWFPIGHQLALTVCVAVGELAAHWVPRFEQEYERELGPIYGGFYWARFFASFVSPLAAAGSVVMLYLLVEALGATRHQAIGIALLLAVATPLWPQSSETMSDGLGQFFLFANAAFVFRYVAGRGSGPGTLAVAGLSGGWAVLVRYPHAFAVAVLGLCALWAAWRRGRVREIGWLALAAAPEAALLLAANQWRFGDWLETGYSSGANPAFFSYPSYLGVPLIFLAPGKGVLWFMPLLWLALFRLWRRETLRLPVLPLLLIFVAPIAVFGHTHGWAAGQCFTIRYVTPGAILLTAVVLVRMRPWRRMPKRFALVSILGLFVALTGVVAPYRGHSQLALAAAAQVYPDVPANLHHDRVVFVPRFSPLHTHWIYAWLGWTGRLEQGGSEHTTEPLFGVQTPGAAIARRHEDIPPRHWWMAFWSHRFGVSFWALCIPWTLATVGLLWWSVRRLLRLPDSATPD